MALKVGLRADRMLRCARTSSPSTSKVTSANVGSASRVFIAWHGTNDRVESFQNYRFGCAVLTKQRMKENSLVRTFCKLATGSSNCSVVDAEPEQGI